MNDISNNNADPNNNNLTDIINSFIPVFIITYDLMIRISLPEAVCCSESDLCGDLSL